MRKIILLMLLLIVGKAFSQKPSSPVTFPVIISTGYYKYGFIQSDSGFIFTERDTFPAKYPTLIKHINHNFYYTNGYGDFWHEFTGSGGGGGGSDNCDIYIDTVWKSKGEFLDTLKYSRDGVVYNAAVFYHQSGLLDGGRVSWSGTGLTYDVTNAIYTIKDGFYTSAAGQATLPNGDATFDTWNVIALDTNKNIVVIHGTPSANPEIPQVDEDSQLPLIAINVGVGATVPTGFTSEVIYNENIPPEWSNTAFGIAANFDNFGNTYLGAKSIDVPAWVSGNYLRFFTASPKNIADYSIINLRVKLKASLPTGASIGVYFVKSGATVSKVITLAAKFGFTGTLTSSYQNIVIPLSAFPFANTSFDEVRIRFTGSATGAYIDYVNLQGGLQQAFNEIDPVALSKTISLNAGANIAILGNTTQTLSTNPSWTISATVPPAISYDANNGITPNTSLSPTTFQLGGNLLQNTTIGNGAFSLDLTGNRDGYLLFANNASTSANSSGLRGFGNVGVLGLSSTNSAMQALASSGAVGLTATSVSGAAISANSTSGSAGSFTSSGVATTLTATNNSTGTGLRVQALSGGTGANITSSLVALNAVSLPTANNAVAQVAKFSANGANDDETVGFGPAIDLAGSLPSTPSLSDQGRLSTSWTDVASATRSAKFTLQLTNNAAYQNVLEILPTGSTKLSRYGLGTFTGTGAYNLAVDATGNIIEVASGGGGSLTNTQIGFGNASNQLSGSADFTYSGNNTLSLSRQATGLGTVSTSAAQPNVTGVGTDFLGSVKPGDQITIGAETRTVASVGSNTALSVSPNWTNANTSQPYTLNAISGLYVRKAGMIGIGIVPTEMLHIKNDWNGATKILVDNSFAGGGSTIAAVRLKSDVETTGFDLYAAGTATGTLANTSGLNSNGSNIWIRAAAASKFIKLSNPSGNYTLNTDGTHTATGPGSGTATTFTIDDNGITAAHTVLRFNVPFTAGTYGVKRAIAWAGQGTIAVENGSDNYGTMSFGQLYQPHGASISNFGYQMYLRGNGHMSLRNSIADNGYRLEVNGDVYSKGQLNVDPITSLLGGSTNIFTSGTAGTTTITYMIVPKLRGGQVGLTMTKTINTANATLSATNYVFFDFFVTEDHIMYDIYRTATNGTSPTTLGKIGTVYNNPNAYSGHGTLFTDTGLPGDGSTAPTYTSNKLVSVGVGTSAPTAMVHISNSQGNPGTAPLKLTKPFSIALNSVNGDGTRVRLTYASQPLAPFPVGTRVQLSGVTPAGYNGIYIVESAFTGDCYLTSTTNLGFASVTGTASHLMLQTPEDGAIEYDGTHYYGTIGSTRYQLDLSGAVTLSSLTVNPGNSTFYGGTTFQGAVTNNSTYSSFTGSAVGRTSILYAAMSVGTAGTSDITNTGITGNVVTNNAGDYSGKSLIGVYGTTGSYDGGAVTMTAGTVFTGIYGYGNDQIVNSSTRTVYGIVAKSYCKYGGGSAWNMRAMGVGNGTQINLMPETGQLLLDSFTTGGQTLPWAIKQVGTHLPSGFAGSVNIGYNGNGTLLPVASAALQVNSVTKGFLPPRMSTTERTAIASPAEGLMVYDMTLHKLYVWDGTVWQAAW